MFLIGSQTGRGHMYVVLRDELHIPTFVSAQRPSPALTPQKEFDFVSLAGGIRPPAPPLS